MFRHSNCTVVVRVRNLGLELVLGLRVGIGKRLGLGLDLGLGFGLVLGFRPFRGRVRFNIICSRKLP